MAKKPKLGSGQRFKNLVSDIRRKDHNIDQESAEAVAAAIGRKKFGNKRFQKLAMKGK